MANEQMHTMNHVGQAAHETLGSPAPTPAMPMSLMLEDEIRILRHRGFSDDCIDGLLAGFGIETTQQIERRHTTGLRSLLSPLSVRNQLIPLIWGKPVQLYWSSDIPSDKFATPTGPSTFTNPTK